MSTKKIITNQQYEEYWKITLEYSNIYDRPFNTVLEIIVKYIDLYSNKEKGLPSEKYKDLQNEIEKIFPKNDSASTRKSINQMFKLGFINNNGRSYHYLTKVFLKEKNKNRKKSLFSKIVYENASFSRSFKNSSDINEIKFLIKTIEACGKITKEELLAIMYCNIDEYKKGYLSKDELAFKMSEIENNGAIKRKYNQLNYLYNLCKTLTDIYESNGSLTLDPNLSITGEEKNRLGRDTYLQRLYKRELINEEKDLYNINQEMCVLEHKSYPVLIASHIKPYRYCDEKEQFDKNNGLLLSKNFDSLFDLGYITFDDVGNVITSSKLTEDVSDYVKKFKLDEIIYNPQRKAYMEFHRNNVFLG